MLEVRLFVLSYGGVNERGKKRRKMTTVIQVYSGTASILKVEVTRRSKEIRGEKERNTATRPPTLIFHNSKF